MTWQERLEKDIEKEGGAWEICVKPPDSKHVLQLVNRKKTWRDIGRTERAAGFEGATGRTQQQGFIYILLLLFLADYPKLASRWHIMKQKKASNITFELASTGYKSKKDYINTSQKPRLLFWPSKKCPNILKVFAVSRVAPPEASSKSAWEAKQSHVVFATRTWERTMSPWHVYHVIIAFMGTLGAKKDQKRAGAMVAWVVLEGFCLGFGKRKGLLWCLVDF